MPIIRGRRRYKKRSIKRKTFKRSTGRRRGVLGNSPQTMLVSKGLGFPDNFISKLRYSDRFDLTPSVDGTAVSHTFTANGLFDPNVTGGGHQPMYFDQFMLIYNHYKVLGSRIRFDFSISGTAVEDVSMILCYLDDNATATANPSTAVETGRISNITMLGGPYGKTGRKSATLSFSLKKNLGYKRFTDEVTGNVASNPNEQMYYQIVAALQGNNNAQTISVRCVIDYIVQFTELAEITAS